jgi:hypothetical protein
MPRGVQPGSKRGRYRDFTKPRLHKLARDIRAGRIDPDAVAEAFENTGQFSDRLIADSLRMGGKFSPQRLANAVENLAVPSKRSRAGRPLPLWLVKAALRHLPKEYGGKGEPIHKALRVDYPYNDHPRVRAYHRQLKKDYGPRSKGRLEQELDDRWPERTRGQHPEMERAIREHFSGYGIPLEVWRGIMRRRYVKQP